MKKFMGRTAWFSNLPSFALVLLLGIQNSARQGLIEIEAASHLPLNAPFIGIPPQMEFRQSLASGLAPDEPYLTSALRPPIS